MNSHREVPMLRLTSLAAALGAVLATGGCDLNVENPNAPDAPRAFADPAGLQQLLGGSFRTWVEARSGYFVMPLTAQADNYTASWNNAAIRFYTSVGAECPSRCGWSNSATAAEAAGGPTVEAQWYGYYAVLAAANNVLLGIKAGICFDDDCAVSDSLTSRNTAIAKMMQGMALAGIALIYDQGFFVDENTPPSAPSAIPFSTRAALRDSALAKFQQAYTLAGVKPFETEAGWMGVSGGTSYTSTEIRQVIRTMEAELIAMWPRNSTENAAADWAQVATYASQGVSSGTPFDWQFFIDAAARDAGIEYVKNWGNSIGTMRVDTRVAALITTNHVDPWPEPNGNPCPTTSPDLRVGDGSYGPTNDFNGYATIAYTGNEGTDYACSGVPIFPPARGQYHQSNLQHVRYEALSNGEGLPTSDGTGQDPFYTTQMNDLLWAEGLIRRPAPDLATAATLINNSRVGRGGLSTLTAADGAPALLAALQYEQEIEFMGQGATPFFNRRRIDGLTLGTPRQMPVPAKELDGLSRAVYTFGGPSSPDMVAGGEGSTGSRGPTVVERWREIQALKPASSSRRRS